MNKKITYDEQETVIIIPAVQVSRTAEVYTCVPTMLKKLRKQAKDRPDCVRIKQDDGESLFADVDSSCVRITPKKQISEEQRKASAERFRKMRGDTT